MKNKTVNISIDGKEYISLSVPEGSKVTIQDGVTLVEPFKIDPEKYIPKIGDCFKTDHELTSVCGSLTGAGVVSKGSYITSGQISDELNYNACTSFFHSNTFTKTTPDELQAEFKKLGYEYDFETNTAVKIRWRAKLNEEYFYIDDQKVLLSDYDQGSSIDDKRYNAGNYFQTAQLAEQCAEIEKDARMKFHNELK